MSEIPLEAKEVAGMNIEFLECDYEWVDLDELDAAEAIGADSGEPDYLAWFIDSSAGLQSQARA